MSNNTIPLTKILPVELFHRIFDHLDIETILFSIRPVCRLLRSAVNNYNRYVLNMKLISKLNFDLFCRLIHPEQVISLTLVNDEQIPHQIAVFISSVRLQELTRLRFLTLRNIDEDQLNIILNHINLDHLISFIFTFRKSNNISLETTKNHLSSIIKKSTLRKLGLDLHNVIFPDTDDKNLSRFAWPINCTIRDLTVKRGICIDDLYTILHYCSHINTLNVKLANVRMSNNITRTCFQQLTSLSIGEFGGTMDELEPFLLSTPSLVYLKLIDGREMLNGKQWEQFIQINLLHLNQFEFFFEVWDYVERTTTDIELIIDSFRTPFWIEHKRWFINCEYGIRGTNIHLYSIPFYKSYLEYNPEYKKTLLSTSIIMKEDETIMMKNIKSLKLPLDQLLADHIQEKKTARNSPMCPNVTAVELAIYHQWPEQLFPSLSIFIDISYISEIIWDAEQYDNNLEDTFIKFGVFLEQFPNLVSLFIRNCDDEESEMIDKICSFIPYHIKYLQMPMRNFKQIKTILKRCENLFTIQFDFQDFESAEKVVKWFDHNTVHSSCHNNDKTVNVWLGKINIQPTGINHNNKRIKLTDS